MIDAILSLGHRDTKHCEDDEDSKDLLSFQDLPREIKPRSQSKAFSQIPYATEQGIISTEQGILAQEQGISPAKTEIIAE
jgi:hypothetical protein